MRIKIAIISVIGNLRNGFSVASDVLLEMNKKVLKVLGVNLAIVELLKQRQLQSTGNHSAHGELDSANLKSYQMG